MHTALVFGAFSTSGESQSLDNISVLVYMYYEVRKPQKTLKPPRVLLAQ